MNINNAFPSRWLKSGDIEGEDLVLTITGVTIETVGQGEDSEEKPVLTFAETDKGLVLNKTNATTIAALYTPETDNWPGKKISLFSTEVQFGSKMTVALRVRTKAPKASGNGAELLTADQAKAAVLAAGLTVDDLKAILPERDGKRVYSPERDSQKVRDLIAQNTPVAEAELE